MLTSFYQWLENCFSWFFPSTLLSDPFIALIIKGLEFFFGLWLLYIYIGKPILMIFRLFDEKVYKGR